MAAKAPFVLVGEKSFNPRKFDCQVKTGGPETAIRVNRREQVVFSKLLFF